jgi:hypothetical protein
MSVGSASLPIVWIMNVIVEPDCPSLSSGTLPRHPLFTSFLVSVALFDTYIGTGQEGL